MSLIVGPSGLITDYSMLAYGALGSSVKGQSIGFSVNQITTSVTLADGQLRGIAVWVPQAATITGVRWYQATQGVYTADNNNKVGLYSYSGGTLTLVASSTDDGNIWKAASGTWGTKDFSATYGASPGIYFVAMLYNSSAQTTAPAIGSNSTIASTVIVAFDFTNSAKLNWSVNSQTNITTPLTISGLSGNTASHILFLY